MFNKNYIIGGLVILAIVAGIMFWSRDNSSTPDSSTQQSEQKAPVRQAPRIISGKVTAYITDQYGNLYGSQLFGYSPEKLKILREQYGSNYTPGGVRIVSYALYDALGERVQAGYPGIKDGVFETEILPPGTYTLYVPSVGGFMDIWYETPAVKTFNLPAEGINLGNLTIMSWGRVRVKVTNEVGTGLGAEMTITRCETTDALVKEYYKNHNISKCSSFGFSSLIINGILGEYPAGNYTVRISASGYETVEKSFSVNNHDVDLGTVVLKKK